MRLRRLRNRQNRMVEPPVQCAAMKHHVAVMFGVLALVVSPLSGRTAGTQPHWVGTWMTSVVGRPPYPAAPATTTGATPATPAPARMVFPNNQTLRQIVHVSVGGDRLRVTLTNAFGTAPLTIGAAHVAVRAKEAAIANGTDRALTFSGSSTTTIPAGAVIVSDPVALAVPPLGDLAI